MSVPAKPYSHRQRPSVGARIILTFFALILIAAGVFFTRALWLAYSRADETRHWKPLTAVILTSHVLEDKESLNDAPTFRPVVEYSYIYNGEGSAPENAQAYQAKSIRRVDGTMKDRKQAEELIRNYRQGGSATCYVNPDNPTQAILQHETKAPLYTLWFPMLFVIGGVGMILGAWLRGGVPQTEPAAEDGEATAPTLTKEVVAEKETSPEAAQEKSAETLATTGEESV